jgi:hypothetical protein
MQWTIYIWPLTILALYNNYCRKLPMFYWNEAVMQCTIYMTAHYPLLIQELQKKVPNLCVSGRLRSCSALYIWQLTILAWYKNFSTKFQTYVLVEWCGHAVLYIYDRSLSWLDTITTVESCLCLIGMRWSCSALYIWQLTILAWYKNFSRKFQTYVLVEWGGHAVHYIYDSSISWLDTRTLVESSKHMS